MQCLMCNGRFWIQMHCYPEQWTLTEVATPPTMTPFSLDHWEDTGETSCGHFILLDPNAISVPGTFETLVSKRAIQILFYSLRGHVE